MEWWDTIKEAGAITTTGTGWNPGLYNVSYKKKKVKKMGSDWWSAVKSIDRSTEIAILWTQNYRPLYDNLVTDVRRLVQKGIPEDVIFSEVAKMLPQAMANLKPFMDDLIQNDGGISEVDWLEVARGFKEIIQEVSM